MTLVNREHQSDFVNLAFSLLYCEEEVLDVASDDPPDEAPSCRRRAWDVPKKKR